jgi:hypothetical protein
VDDGLLGALERFEGAANEVFAGLGEHFDGHVAGMWPPSIKPRTKAEFGFGGRGKAISICP